MENQRGEISKVKLTLGLSRRLHAAIQFRFRRLDGSEAHTGGICPMFCFLGAA